MIDVKDALLERTSVRRYEREKIPAETMDFIYKAVENTPTSYNGQQFSVIDIDDQELKEKLYELTNQKQLKTCNRLLIFLSDYNKISLLAEKKGLDIPPFTDTMDGVTIGIILASRGTPQTAQRRIRGLRTCSRSASRTSGSEAQTTLFSRFPSQSLPTGLREDDRRTRSV